MKEFKCNCGKSFLSHKSLNSHARFCNFYTKNKKSKSKYKDCEGKFICECGKCFLKPQSFNAHLSHCDIHHNANGTIRKKRPSELNKTMNWENKTLNERKEIYKKSAKTKAEKITNNELKPTFLGKKHNQKTKEKIRLSTIKNINSLVGNFKCRYNKNSISFIDELNKKNNWNLQHAENGGEICISGYFVDGYDKNLNIVFEYDEQKHYKDVEKNLLCEKDIERQNNIINKLNCDFYRFNEAINYLYKI